MRFFGDRSRDEDPRTVAGEIEQALARAAREPPGPLRHAVVAGALVRAGELAQALGDAADAGAAAGPARAALAEAARLGRALWASFEAGGRAAAPRPRTVDLGGAPAQIRIRRPEGYALYALHPECYGLAGRALRGTRVTCIGLRSIGTGLAAMVAAGAGEPGAIFAVRPGGPPFARHLDPGALREALAAGRSGAFAVVDEGPGLSGSTLAAVAAALLAAGVAPEQVHLVTAHANPPGPEASAEVRTLFTRLPRLAAGPAGAGAPLLSPEALAADLVGEVSVLADVSDGGWRRRVPGAGDAPSTGWMERRKVLLEDRGGRRWLARFAGLGEDGERKRGRAEALHAAGVGIGAVGLRHGWLLERWIEEGRPLAAAGLPRAALLGAIEVLLCASARRPPGEGARPEALVEMIRANAAEALGQEAGDAARRLEAFLPRLAAEARPSELDARLGAWEWRVLPDGRVVKLDGLDHHAGHELTGCQDLLWDVAGAELELGLGPREAVRLAEAARAAAPGADPSLLPFYRVAYPALELGRWWFAAHAVPPGDERRRRDATRERYRRALGDALAASVRAARPAAAGGLEAAPWSPAPAASR